MSSLFGIGGGGNVGAAGGSFYDYTIDQSLRFNAVSESELSRTFAAGNRRKWTFSTWMKRSELTPSGSDDYIFGTNTGAANSTFMFLSWRAGDNLIVTGQSTLWLRSDRVFRDVSGWYHILWSLDTDNATASQRMRLYVNGTELTSFSTDSRSSLTGDQAINAAVEHNIGRHPTATGYGLGAYLAETHFIDGQALDATSFGETINGVWVPKEYSGSYGTNGFYLSFADSAAIGDDLSGNTNDWTANNLAASDVVNDSPTNNHCVMNPLDSYSSGSRLSDGNLKYTGDSINGAHCGTHSFDIANEKFYWEITTVGTNSWLGIVSEDFVGSSKAGNVYSTAGLHVFNPANGHKSQNPYSSTTAFMSTMSANDVLGIACGEGNIELFINGVSQGDAYTGLTGRYKPFAMSATSAVSVFNFGQTSFSYTAPTDYLSLNSENMPELTVGPNSGVGENSTDYFEVALFTGNGSTNDVSSLSFQPDWTVISDRNYSGAFNRHSMDVLRSGQRLRIDDTGVDGSGPTGFSFTSDGFDIGADALSNANTISYISWNWKAGGSGVSNTSGSISSTVSANQTSGVSIVSYTGVNTASGQTSTIGHGLASAPELIICKRRNSSGYGWSVGSTAIGNFTTSSVFELNSTGAPSTTYAYEWGANPTETVFTTGYSSRTNINGGTFIAYCLHSVEGFSKIGAFTGNGAPTFVYCGFRPAFVLVKNIDTSSHHWVLYDNKRDPDNDGSEKYTYWNTSAGENTAARVDFVSNGFVGRANNYDISQSGVKFLFIAYAEQPFKYSNAR